MTHKTVLRTALAAAAFGAALSANAFALTFSGSFTGTFLTANAFDVDTTHSQGLSFNFAVDPASTATATGGTASLSTTLKNFTGSKSLTLSSVNGTSTTFGGTTSFAGDWSGSSVGLAIGDEGTYNGWYDGQGNFSVSIIGGAPVPEPASMIALGVGAFGLLRRRRKA